MPRLFQSFIIAKSRCPFLKFILIKSNRELSCSVCYVYVYMLWYTHVGMCTETDVCVFLHCLLCYLLIQSLTEPRAPQFC